MNHLRLAIQVFLAEGYDPKWIAMKLTISKQTVYRADPERFKTGRVPPSPRSDGKKRNS